LIATALLAVTGSGYAMATYIAFCAIVSIVATILLPDYTMRHFAGTRLDRFDWSAHRPSLKARSSCN